MPERDLMKAVLYFDPKARKVFPSGESYSCTVTSPEDLVSARHWSARFTFIEQPDDRGRATATIEFIAKEDVPGLPALAPGKVFYLHEGRTQVGVATTEDT